MMYKLCEITQYVNYRSYENSNHEKVGNVNAGKNG